MGDYQLWAKSAEEEQAMLYNAQAARRKEEWNNLAREWKNAAAEKEEKKMAEREVNYQMCSGMVPQRRMKRGQPAGWPRQQLVLRQEVATFGNVTESSGF